MGHRSDRDALRGNLYAVDVPALMDALNDEIWPEDALQLMGDAVLVVARARVDAAGPAGHRCAAALRDRGWEGDHELADQIDAMLGVAPTPFLKSLPVDLEELAGILEGDPVVGGLTFAPVRSGRNRRSSTSRKSGNSTPTRTTTSAGSMWLAKALVPRTGTWRCSSALWATDESADRLAQAIHGRGAFRRFKDALADSDDLLARWYGLSDDRHRGRARAWLADEGYTPTPTKPSDA